MYLIILRELSAVFRNFPQFGCIKVGFLFILVHQVVGIGDYYCSLCEDHVGCNNDGSQFGLACSNDAAMVKMDNSLTETILKLHNEMRNQIALGNITKYSSATKMPYLQWDNELAYLAELNARSCAFNHDKCRKTKKYPRAGQNIAELGNTAAYEEKDVAISNMINKWFAEYEDADMRHIYSYAEYTEKIIGHFTVMVNDKNNAIGCAISRFQRNFLGNNYKYNYFVCNYGYRNVWREQVYEPGQTASKCIKQHPHYKGLCYTKEDTMELSKRTKSNFAASLSQSPIHLFISVFILLFVEISLAITYQ